MKKAKIISIIFLLAALSSEFSFNTPSTAAFSYRSVSPLSKVLGEADLYPYASGSLINENGTIYFIVGKDKVPFTNYAAFVGLGYSLKNVVDGNLSGYRLAQSYFITTAQATHPWGSWLLYNHTVYYSHESGLIGVPNWDIFVSNGGKAEYIVGANKYDIEELNKQPNNPILASYDNRVYGALSFTPTPLPLAPPSPTPTPTPAPLPPTPAPQPSPQPGGQPTSTPVSKLNSKMGTYYVPKNFPQSVLLNNTAEIDEYFNATKQVGGHIAVLQRWDEPNLDSFWQQAQAKAKTLGLKFYLHIDPLTGYTHSGPAVPASVSSTNSFSDPTARQAFKNAMLNYASLHPDVLGIGTEVNLMLYHNNPSEFNNYVSLAKETYDAIKQQYPGQTVTISFSWDIMRIFNQYNILAQFKNSADVFSFTTYPNVISAQDPLALPTDFFGSIRAYLPSERVAISEMSWFAGGTGSEDLQKKYYERLPQLLSGLNPEFVTITYLYDLPQSFVPNTEFNSAGMLRADGSLRPSWQAVLNYNF